MKRLTFAGLLLCAFLITVGCKNDKVQTQSSAYTFIDWQPDGKPELLVLSHSGYGTFSIEAQRGIWCFENGIQVIGLVETPVPVLIPAHKYYIEQYVKPEEGSIGTTNKYGFYRFIPEEIPKTKSST